MRCQKLDDVALVLDPLDRRWDEFEAQRFELTPAPLPLQPTEYIRAAWAGRRYGEVPYLEAAAAHDGRDLVVRLCWPAVQQHERDGAALALPVRGNPVLATMGSADAPVHILHWIAAVAGVRSVLATGIGTSREGPRLRCSARSAWHRDKYHLVIARALGVAADTAPLLAGAETRIGFAVWAGANRERAGIKAYSIAWQPLQLPA